jgi:hypothetical protein
MSFATLNSADDEWMYRRYESGLDETEAAGRRCHPYPLRSPSGAPPVTASSKRALTRVGRSTILSNSLMDRHDGRGSGYHDWPPPLGITDS